MPTLCPGLIRGPVPRLHGPGQEEVQLEGIEAMLSAGPHRQGSTLTKRDMDLLYKVASQLVGSTALVIVMEAYKPPPNLRGQTGATSVSLWIVRVHSAFWCVWFMHLELEGIDLTLK